MKRIVRTLLLLIATLTTALGLALAFSSCSSSATETETEKKNIGGTFRYSETDFGYAVEYSWDSATNEIEEIKFPDTYKKKPITALSRGRFGNDETFPIIKKVIIPASVRLIEKEAFQNGQGIEEIVFEEGSQCTEIKSKAFKNCKALKTCLLPESIAKIGEEAFFGCSGLENFTIPKNVTRIYPYAFASCTSLKTITIPEGITEIEWGVFQYCAPNSITFPTSLKTIAPTAFSYSNVPSFTLPEGLTSIGNDAFWGAKLTAITIPASVQTVGKDAFKNCEGLKSVALKSLEAWCAIQFANEEANPVKYAESLALNGTPITKLEIPQGVARIGAYAFINCLTLTEIILPKSVQSIGTGAFSGCTQITKIHLADLTAWCTMQFDDLTAAPFGDDTNLYMDGNPLTEITIPDSVKTLREGAFRNCSTLQTVHLGKVTSVGANAFAGCTALTKVYIPSTVTKIAENTFGACENLTIYAQPILKPHGWHENWNPLNRPVQWGQASM